MNIIDILALASLAVFFILLVGRTVLLYRMGIKVWVIGTSSKNIIEKLFEIVLVPFLIIWSIFVVIIASHINLPQTITKYLINILLLKYIGIIFCYIGLIIFLLALASFGKSWRIGIDEEKSNELITDGIFKYSRNPIFVFMDIYFLGIALIYPNIVFIMVAIVIMIFIHLQILREEKFLLNKFGEKYLEYKKQTRRYV